MLHSNERIIRHKVGVLNGLSPPSMALPGLRRSPFSLPWSAILNVRFATIPCTKSLFLEGTKHVVPLAWVWDRGA